MSDPAILGSKPVFEKFVPIIKPTLPSLDEIKDDLKKILESGMITNFEYTKKLEEFASKYIGVKHCVAVGNCTAGLIFVNKYLGLEGEVITPSFTFVATGHSLLWNNIAPVFADINKETFTIDIEDVKKKITEKTTAIQGVHIFGNPCQIKELHEIAEENDVKLIFDAAHAMGSEYNHEKIGKFGAAEVFSMTPTKIVTACEGGIVATNDDELAEKARAGRDYGNFGYYDNKILGLSARMSEINALIGLKSMEMLEKNLSRRNKIAETYQKRLSSVPGIDFQHVRKGNKMTYQTYSIIINEKEFGMSRDILANALKSENIGTKTMYFYPPNHKQKTFEKYKGFNLPVTEHISKNIISLPMFSHLELETAEKICDAIDNIQKHSDKITR